MLIEIFVEKYKDFDAAGLSLRESVQLRLLLTERVNGRRSRSEENSFETSFTIYLSLREFTDEHYKR